jgi:SAM-dependent methyltransferase
MPPVADGVRQRIPAPLRDALRAAGTEVGAVRQRLSGGPVPPRALRARVPGDFFAVGREFGHYLVDLGGLRPGDRVLDVGFRVGRLAIPLASYLGPEARYDGVDDWPEAVAWSRRVLTARHPNFQFHQVAMVEGTGAPGRPPPPEVLPFGDGAFDFVLFVSINHLTPEHFDFYLRESARLLAAGGTYFGTWYLADRLGGSPPGTPGPGACGEETARARLGALGLGVEAVHRGGWDGHRPALSFQDVVIARKDPVPTGPTGGGPG